MTSNQLAESIGKNGIFQITPELAIPVAIRDAKLAYGNVRYLVSPIGGKGQSWVNADRVTVK